ncbi:hypothetical protein EYF80_005238 [Liparis tanakae]|uniref:Uncharacterized protein n=1 Tax=Liparis tanakae TaxID=230148 RepID=A0A4Z2J4B6_9TELE|nr:hypothetical protein EYF80_005238 [Liparis tanakae]
MPSYRAKAETCYWWKCGCEEKTGRKLTRTVTTSFSQEGNLAMILVMKEAMVSPESGLWNSASFSPSIKMM